MLIEPVIAAQINAHRLGDLRLNKRCHRVQKTLLLGDTSQSFPQLFPDPYQLKAFYRLLHNPNLKPQTISQGYGRGLTKWAKGQPHDQRYWFVFQDSTFGKYHNHSLELGYLQVPTDNGILLHHGILTDDHYVPLGLPVQEFMLRERDLYGKAQQRKQRPFAHKESAKWLKAIDWAAKFSRQTGRQLIQVCDKEADIAELMNYALAKRQAFLIAAHHDRPLRDSSQTLSSYESSLGQGEIQERSLLDGQGNMHVCRCSIRYGPVALQDFIRPIWVVYLQQLDPIDGQQLAHWTLLTSLPIDQLSSAVYVLDAYRHRWPTCEDFHKCLKSGCSIEKRQLHSRQALFGAIGLLSLVAIGLQRLRHLGRQHPNTPVVEVLDTDQLAVAHQLAGRYLTASDQCHCVTQSVLWFVLVLARLGGHQGVAQSGLPGWQTIWRGYRQFSLLVDGYIMSKNEYYEQKPPT